MIPHAQFDSILRAALAFANLPEGFTPAEAAACFRAGTGLRRITGNEVEIDWPSLHVSWHQFLRHWLVVSSRRLGPRTAPAQREKMERAAKRGRAWCEQWARNAAVYGLSLSASPLEFDEAGTPQLVLGASDPSALLAITAAELIAPTAVFGVRQCAAEGCKRFFLVRLGSERERGRPPRFCPLPSHFRSTERVHRFRARQAQERQRSRRPKHGK